MWADQDEVEADDAYDVRADHILLLELQLPDLDVLLELKLELEVVRLDLVVFLLNLVVLNYKVVVY